MKKLSQFSWAYSMVGVALCSILFSFSGTSISGGHSFQVYLDGKLLIDRYVNSKMDVPKVLLNPTENYSQLIVKYNECGRTVAGRKITLKDDNNKVLKDWRFEGETSGYKESMSCRVKDILELRPKGSNTVKLYYSSNEFPAGQQIAYLVISDKTTAALK